MSIVRWMVAVSIGIASQVSAWAAPKIRTVSPPALRIGGTSELVVSGSGLTADTRLLLPFEAKVELRPGASADSLKLAVTVPETAPVGHYAVRAANASGISNPLVVAVDDLPNQPVTESIRSMPIALIGEVAGNNVVRVSFAGKKGQAFVADVEARRLGSLLDPSLTLFNARGVQISYAIGTPRLSGDARIVTTLPEDGSYTIELHDHLYKAPAGTSFRIKLGELHFADFAFPMGVKVGQKIEGRFAGRIPDNATAIWPTTGIIGDEVPAPLPKLAGRVGPTPRLIVSDIPETVQNASGQVQDLPLPGAVTGRLLVPEDRYRVAVTPGAAIRIDLRAQRFGSPLDGVVTVYNEQGGTLASADDSPNSADPLLNFKVPANVKTVLIGVKDSAERTGSDYVYRLAITGPKPDFALSVLSNTVQIPQGGSAIVRVRATRPAGPQAIELRVPDLPAGVRVTNATILAGHTDTLLTLTADNQAPLTQQLFRVEGSLAGATRLATILETPTSRVPAPVRGNLGLAVVGPSPLSVTWLPTEEYITPGVPIEWKFEVKRPAGAVRLSLLTSQLVPKVPNNPNVDDVNKAIRFEGSPTIPADKSDSTAKVLVPADLPTNVGYDLAVQAELLDAKGAVIATTTTPVRRVVPTAPFTVQLTSGPKLEIPANPETPGKIAGKIVRHPNFRGDVELTVTGLPGKLTKPTIVPANQTEFTLPIAVPANSKLGPIKNVQLIGVANGVAPGSLKSTPVPLNVTITAPPPPKKEEKKEDKKEEKK